MSDDKPKPKNLRKVYCLRTRIDESHQWSEEEVFESRKERNAVAAECRVLCGIRTHSFERYEKSDDVT